jgi:hypothetical protein
VKFLRQALVTTAIVFAANAAGAATLGTIEYNTFVHVANDFRADLGGGSPLIADAPILINTYNGLPVLPFGLPANTDIHIPATFIGDFTATTADPIDDRYLFKLDPSTLGTATAANADATLNLVVGVSTGIQNSVFALFQSDFFGNTLGGPLGTRVGAGNLLVANLDSTLTYLLRVTGNLRADNPNVAGNDSINVASYDIVLGLVPVPVPPAVLLLLTAVGALFGFGRLRRKTSAVAIA